MRTPSGDELCDDCYDSVLQQLMRPLPTYCTIPETFVYNEDDEFNLSECGISTGTVDEAWFDEGC